MISKEILESQLDKGKTIKEVAESLGVSCSTVSRYKQTYGLKTKIGTQGARTHRFNEDYFKVIDSEEKAYWLGFIAADGCVYKNSNAWRLQINLKRADKHHLDKFQRAIGSDYKIAEKLVNTSEVCQLKINSKTMCDDLIALGIIQRKSLVIEMPTIHRSMVRHFIRGYFDGDGNIKNFVDKNNRLRYNFNIVGGLSMLNSINKQMPCTLEMYKINRTNDIYSLETTSKEKLVLIYDFLYKDSNVFLERKRETYSNLMSRFVEMQRQ